jgi:hypothetical protein
MVLPAALLVLLPTPSAVSLEEQCPCTIWPSTATPAATDPDTSPVELGVKFRASQSGFITGIRYFKPSAATGTHVGTLWSGSGSKLGQVTFTGETGSGWQQANFTQPIQITAGTTYVASYHAPSRYAVSSQYFANGPTTRGPLTALQNGTDGGNGVYRYTSTPSQAMPESTYQGENYWVDVVFNTDGTPPPDTTKPTLATRTPAPGATDVPVGTTVSAQFSEPVQQSTIQMEVRNPGGTLVNGATAYNSATQTATFTPAAALAANAAYTVNVSGAQDPAGNTMDPASWTFTTAPPAGACPCTIWPSSATPSTQAAADNGAVELGVKFRAAQNGYITGIRFYKGNGNTGTHTGNLWTSAGTNLSSVVFANETASGWQQATFPQPVPVTAGTTYVGSYHAPVGRYAINSNFFTNQGVTRGPLTALQSGVDGANGVYRYGASGFPFQSYSNSNYWVDIVFDTQAVDSTPPGVAAKAPAANATGVSTGTNVTVTFNEPVVGSSVLLELRNAAGNLVEASTSYDATTHRATLAPDTTLAPSTTYTATVSGARDTSPAGNQMAPVTWSFMTEAPPPPPPDQGPGGPVALVTSGANPSSRYLVEILRAEGLNEFANVEATALNSSMLAGYDVVVVGNVGLTSGQITALTNWVNAGGNLIAMRPSAQLAPLMGLTVQSGTTSSGYLAVDAATEPGAGITTDTMQYHGPATHYALAGAQQVARLYSSPTTATSFPAVTLRTVGSNGGQAAAFAYDLASSVIQTRQGNPAWAGQERDFGIDTIIRSDDLFFGGSVADWVNLDKVHIPQADEQQRLLANLITVMNRDQMPMPRFWYFPNMHKAVVVATGDDHSTGGTAGRFNAYSAASPSGCSVVEWQCLRFTSYVYPNSPLTNQQATNYAAQGFEVSLHPQNGCRNFTSLADLQETYSDRLAEWQASYPGLQSPKSNRFHCLVWSDWASQPKAEAQLGMRLDVNYYYFPGSWMGNKPGFMNGSGIPMRFTDSDGALLDVYQSNTVMTDESGQSYPFTPDTLIARAKGAQGYYGAFTANMHSDQASTVQDNALVATARREGVPMITARQLLTWLDGRNTSSFKNLSWSGNALSFTTTVGAGANGLMAMLPTSGPGGLELATVNRAGSAVSFSTTTIKGQEYAVFSAGSGVFTATYQASGGLAISPARTTDLGDDSATLTWTTDEPATATVRLGTAPNRISSRERVSESTQRHSVDLGDLAPGRTYYYRVVSTDSTGNTRTWPAPTDPPATFRTDAEDERSPVISAVTVTPLPDGTARVAWTTDEPSDSVVEFGRSRQRLTGIRLDDAQVRRHTVVVTDLRARLTYWLRVSSTDASGNVATTRAPIRFVAAASGLADQTATQFRTGSSSGQAVVDHTGFGSLTLRGSGTGRFISAPLDSGQMVDWQRADWDATVPVSTRLTVSVRTGSMSEPDGSWSAWRPVRQGGRIASAGRYLQYRVHMTAFGSAVPALGAIGFTHNGEVPEIHGERAPENGHED